MKLPAQKQSFGRERGAHTRDDDAPPRHRCAAAARSPHGRRAVFEKKHSLFLEDLDAVRIFSYQASRKPNQCNQHLSIHFVIHLSIHTLINAKRREMFSSSRRGFVRAPSRHPGSTAIPVPDHHLACFFNEHKTTHKFHHPSANSINSTIHLQTP
jgi:hypothetical protein